MAEPGERTHSDWRERDIAERLAAILDVPWMTAPFLGTLLAVFIACRLLLSTGLNTNTALTVLSDAGVGTVVLGALISLIPIAIVVLPMFCIFQALEHRHIGKSPTRTLVGLVVSLLLVVAIAPWVLGVMVLGTTAIIMLADLVAFVLVRKISMRSEPLLRISAVQTDSHVNLLEAQKVSYDALASSTWRTARLIRTSSHSADDAQYVELLDDLFRALTQLRPGLSELLTEAKQHQQEAHTAAEIVRAKRSWRRWVEDEDVGKARPSSLRGPMVVLLIGYSFFAMVQVLLLPLWLPQENIEVGAHGSVSGYVLSANPLWTTVVQTPSNEVARFKSPSVTLRVACREKVSFPLDADSILGHLAGLGHAAPRVKCVGGPGGV